jgi:ABC-type sugar transport system ATPase subunit
VSQPQSAAPDAPVGENGAGKPTLLKVLTGVHRADAARLMGVPVARRRVQIRHLSRLQRAA